MTMATLKAVALITGGDNNNPVSGSLHFLQDRNGVTHVKGKIKGLSPGLHGFHIHALGDTSNGCNSTGPHFNPLRKDHGAPTDTHRHAGDLGNIVADTNGVAEVSIKDVQIPLSGEHSILGRAVVVHADADDLGRGGHELSKSTGNAGARIGCGRFRGAKLGLVMSRSAEEGECHALIEAIKWAKDLNIQNITFEGDCKRQVSFLRNEDNILSWKNVSLISFAMSIASTICNINHNWVPRSANVVADILANHARNSITGPVLIDGPPPDFLKEAIIADLSASSFYYICVCFADKKKQYCIRNFSFGPKN